MNSVQERFAPHSICFGCGPANAQGLRIRSRESTRDGAHPHELELEFKAESHHEAFPGMVNGGIIGSLLDCHSNWTAAMALKGDQPEPPCTVTADFHVKLRAPTPTSQKMVIRAWPIELKADRAQIQAELWSESTEGQQKLTATCTGWFVAVRPGHPAYHRWS